jgi:hypothetical protein
VDQLDRCFPNEVPSLLGCERLEINGPVAFASGVILRGQVKFENADSERVTIAPGTYEDTTVALS